MANVEMDTDTLLALLSSLLHPLEYDQTTLIDALVRSHGDTEAAAISLRSETPRKKRKVSRNSDLDGWLRGKPVVELGSEPVLPQGSSLPKKRIDESRLETQNIEVNPSASEIPSSSPPTKPISKPKPVTNAEFMALLRPPNSSGDSRPQPQRQPPLTLISPEHVSQHTPCTLHNSILSPELACEWVLRFYACH